MLERANLFRRFPEMQWEFAVKHDLRWLERWGLVYYGCCEPLDLKIDVLRRIPNCARFQPSTGTRRAPGRQGR